MKNHHLPFYDDSKQEQIYCSYVEELTFSPHFHEQVEMLYVIDGEIEVSVNGEDRILRKQEFVIVFPQKIHFYQTKKNANVYLIIFSINLLNDFYKLFREAEPIYPFIISTKNHDQLIASIDLLFGYIRKLDPDFMTNKYYAFRKGAEHRMAKGYLQLLLCNIFELLELRSNTFITGENSVLKCIRYVMAHYLEPIQLADIAEHTGISRVQVSRIFSKKIGHSFPDYLNDFRINHASELLRTTDKNILDICYESGFDAPSTFYYYFQRKYNMSPKKFRKDYQ